MLMYLINAVPKTYSVIAVANAMYFVLITIMPLLMRLTEAEWQISFYTQYDGLGTSSEPIIPHTHIHTHTTGSKLCCQTPIKHTTDICEPLYINHQLLCTDYYLFIKY